MDFLLLLVVCVLGSGYVIEALDGKMHFGLLAIAVVIAGWLLAMVLTSKSVSHTEIYPIQTFEQNGQTYQVYLNDDDKVTNLTEKFGRLFSEGSVLKETLLQRWHLCCYCLMGEIGSREVWIPTENGEMVKFPNTVSISRDGK